MLDWLAQRATDEEQMDAADLSPRDYALVLRDLARLNALTLSARPTIGFLDRIVARRTDSAPLRLLDVGFGAGDMLRRIARWAGRRNVPVALTGIDLNPKSAAVAAALTPPDAPIEYRTGDYRDLAGQDWDVITSSLVTHHMNDDQRLAFVLFMEAQSAGGWFINDLARNRFAHAGFPLLARVLNMHAIVRADGRLSIARSFRRADWDALLRSAGVADAARIERWFPFRLCVARLR